MSYKVFQLVCVVEIAHFTRRGPDAWRIMALIFVLRILIPLNGFLEYVHVPGPWSTVFGTWSWNDLYEFMHLSTTVLIHATAPVSMTTVDGNNFASRKERRKSKYNMVTPPPPQNINVVFGSDVAWPKSFSRK